jgi:FkbM family methyltransferase
MQHNLIYDVGLHDGQDSEFYLLKGFSVVAIEANPLLAAAARKRFESFISSGQLKILNIGISEVQEESLPFYVNKTNTQWSSFDINIGSRGLGSDIIEVQTTTLDKVLLEHGIPYYLKIDIEGMDLTAIKSLSSIKTKPLYISAENGQSAMIDELIRQGYCAFQYINQKHIPGTKHSNPSLEGLSIDYSFLEGASGEFGKDLSGDWLAPSRMYEISRQYWDNPLRDDSVDGWYDIHAKLFP